MNFTLNVEKINIVEEKIVTDEIVVIYDDDDIIVIEDNDDNPFVMVTLTPEEVIQANMISDDDQKRPKIRWYNVSQFRRHGIQK